MGEASSRPPGRTPTMNRTALLAARLRDLQARSEATDHAAAATLQDLKAAGQQLADAITRLADAMQSEDAA
jgi:hypothetical protein